MEGGETDGVILTTDADSQVAPSWIAENLDAFAAAALGGEKLPIDPAGILQTVAALDAVFRSVDADGAWQQV